jgi:predicted helicase
MTAEQYIKKINQLFQSGVATEHTYRATFQNYMESLLPDILVVNEAARVKIGMPDFTLFDKKNIPFAYIETKDIGENLNDKKHREQFARYKKGFDTLILTDYLDFHFYFRGEHVFEVKLAQQQGKQIVPHEDLYTPHTEGVRRLEHRIQSLLNRDGVNITIKSAEDLAKRMAEKAQTFAYFINKALDINDESFEIAEGSLSKQFESFKQILIGDISHAAFADIYAQTVTYGMFAARLHDETLQDFSRQEAADLIPKSNPFLRKLFQYIASHDLDDRIRPIVDDLAEVFRYTDVASILKDFGRKTQQSDPMIHFYETFLAHYDASLRKARGVWYTPEPVVNFIVRAVDEILKTEFDLKDGLADTSKTKIKVKIPIHDKRYTDNTRHVEKEVHRVQLLDPACGTGTFLAETVKHIHKRFKNQAGIWNSYVEQHLVPRLHGFELLMASYAMAHIKLDLLLRETGFTAKRDSRFRVYLTNSLEEHHKDAQTLFWGQWLADEAAQADIVKRDAPVMVVLGNPPYAISSSNKSEWIEKLMVDYKKDLNERNIQPLSDDYIKFIRFGQHFIDKNTEGVLAYISNNSFIDGLIHRQMRKSLLESFNKIYILDLHGSAKKQETAPDGSTDQNVFDIQQGVSINLFIKTGKTKKKGELAEVFHFDMFGNRNAKYAALAASSLSSIAWSKLDFAPPQYFFVKKDFSQTDSFKQGFAVEELFIENSSGIKTHRDDFVVSFEDNELKKRIKAFYDLSINNTEFLKKYPLKVDDLWLSTKRKGVFNSEKIKEIEYRLFDKRFIYYSGDIVERGREKFYQRCYRKNDISLLICRQQSTFDFQHVFVTYLMSDMCTLSSQTKETGYVFPLYLYKDTDNTDLFSNNTQQRSPNLNAAILDKLSAANGKTFTVEAERDTTTYSPIDVLDYIYAVLHTPQYRERYKEFLKIDFPRVPYPKNGEHWAAMVEQGKILRGLHLLEDEAIGELFTAYPNGGDNTVGKVKYETGKVWLNVTQYFDNVPEAAWQFYIGGYQPAQKWLKDRVGRTLTFEEVLHYQKIIVALTKTKEMMTKLDELWMI